MRTETGQVTYIEGTHRRLGYVQEFRQLLHEHPGILGVALRLIQQAENTYNPPDFLLEGYAELRWSKEKDQFMVIKYHGAEQKPPFEYTKLAPARGVILVPGETLKDEITGLEVTTLGKSDRILFDLFGKALDRIDKSTYFKVKFGNRAFFVKKSTATVNPAYGEFTNSHKVATALRGTKDLTIVEAQFGFDDDNQSWFVSKWEDLEGSGFFPIDTWISRAQNDYGQYLKGRDLEERYEMLGKVNAFRNRVKAKLRKTEIEIHDLNPNLFYNPTNGKYFLLDITVRHKLRNINQL